MDITQARRTQTARKPHGFPETTTASPLLSPSKIPVVESRLREAQPSTSHSYPSISSLRGFGFNEPILASSNVEITEKNHSNNIYYSSADPSASSMLVDDVKYSDLDVPQATPATHVFHTNSPHPSSTNSNDSTREAKSPYDAQQDTKQFVGYPGNYSTPVDLSSRIENMPTVDLTNNLKNTPKHNYQPVSQGNAVSALSVGSSALSHLSSFPSSSVLDPPASLPATFEDHMASAMNYSLPTNLKLSTLQNALGLGAVSSSISSPPTSQISISSPTVSRAVTARRVIDQIAVVHDSNVHRQNRINEASIQLHRMQLTLAHAQHLRSQSLSTSLSRVEDDISLGKQMVLRIGEVLSSHENSLITLEHNLHEVAEEASRANTSVDALAGTVASQHDEFSTALKTCEERLSQQQKVLLRQDIALRKLTSVRSRLDFFVDVIIFAGSIYAIRTPPMLFLSRKLAKFGLSACFPGSMANWSAKTQRSYIQSTAWGLSVFTIIGLTVYLRNIAQKHGIHHGIGSGSTYLQWAASGMSRITGCRDISHYFEYQDEDVLQLQRTQQEQQRLEDEQKREIEKRKKEELEEANTEEMIPSIFGNASQVFENKIDSIVDNLSDQLDRSSLVSNDQGSSSWRRWRREFQRRMKSILHSKMFRGFVPKGVHRAWRGVAEKYREKGLIGLLIESLRLGLRSFLLLIKWLVHLSERGLLKLTDYAEVTAASPSSKKNTNDDARLTVSPTQNQN